MSISERLEDDVKASMRRRDSARLSVLRYLRSEIHNQEIARQGALDDDDVIALLGGQVAQRRDSIAAFQKGGRQDLVQREQAEIAIIQEYLPEQMSEDEIADTVRKAVAETGATGPQDTGRVMGAVMPRVKGRAEGRAVSAMVSRVLKEQADQ